MRGQDSVARHRAAGCSARARAGALLLLPLLPATVAGCSTEFRDCASSRSCSPSTRVGSGGEPSDSSTSGAPPPSRAPDASASGGAPGPGRPAGAGGAPGASGGSGGTGTRADPDSGLPDARPPDARAPCPTGFADCNGSALDGCEAELARDPDHCGACQHACSTAQVSTRRCSAGACQPSCAAHHADCGEPSTLPDDGCETDLDLPASCGACGHDCLGGACAQEQCQPLALGVGLTAPIALTVDARYVHWIDGGLSDGRVVRSPVRGGAATPIVTGQPLPGDIASDGAYVYWTNSHQGSAAVMRVLSGDGTAVPLVTTGSYAGLGAPGPLAVDGVSVYWGDFVTRQGFKMEKSGSGAPAPITPAFGVYPLDVAVDSENAYFAAFEVGLVPLGGAATITPVGAGVANSSVVAVDATHVYFVAIDKATSRTNLSRAPKPTGKPEVVTTPTGMVRALAVDATHLYYADPSGLYRAVKAGGSPEPLSTTVSNPVSVVAQGGAVYWVNQGDPSGATGSIYKLAL